MPRLRIFSLLGFSLAVLFAGSFAQAADQPANAQQSAQQRPAQWAQPVEAKYNLFQMSPTLYRSALPDSGALPLIERLHIATVVNFLPKPDSSWLTTPGITQIQVVFRPVHVDDADVIAALRAITQSERKGPVLIHCKHGLDRTGLMAAMYRTVVQGWSKEDALAEMTQGGFGGADQLKYSIDYVKQANIEAIRTALNSGACSTSAFASCSIKSWFKS